MSTNKRVKWAILGTSPISRTMAKAIQASDTAQLAAIGTGSLQQSAEKAADFSRDFSIPTVHINYQAVLDDPEIDVVYIGLANHLHKKWIIRCANAGKHILCEKPLVIDISEAKEILTAINKNNVFCMEALMYRCHPFIQELQHLINDETRGVGDIKAIHAVYYADFASYENPIAGGAIRNLGCYPVSLIRLLLNEEPVDIQSQGVLNAAQTSENFAMAMMTFKSGVMAQVSTSNNIDTWFQFDVIGTNGVLSVKTNPWKPENENIIVINCHGKETTYQFTADKPLYTYQIDVVNRHVQAQQFTPDTNSVTWKHSLGNIAVLEQWAKQVNKSLSVECDGSNVIYS